MKKASLKLINTIIFLILSFSLLFPHYEILTHGKLDESFSLVSQFSNPHQSGFSGGGFYITYNGFGSITSMLNVLIIFFILIMQLSEKLSRKTLKLMLNIFIVMNLAFFFVNMISPFFLSEPDSFKISFYLSMLLEIAFFYFSFAQIKRLN